MFKNGFLALRALLYWFIEFWKLSFILLSRKLKVRSKPIPMNSDHLGWDLFDEHPRRVRLENARLEPALGGRDPTG